MAKASLTRKDYEQAAARKGLRFTGMVTPKSVYESTSWQCLYCEKEMDKSYRAVYYGQNGCRCRNQQTLGGKEYNDLAERLGIQWVPDHHRGSDEIILPSNTKTVTKWVNPKNGKVVRATYHQLAYGRIPNEVAASLGVNPEINLLQESI